MPLAESATPKVYKPSVQCKPLADPGNLFSLLDGTLVFPALNWGEIFFHCDFLGKDNQRGAYIAPLSFLHTQNCFRQ